MPIIVESPLPGNSFGPGYAFAVHTDTVGPFVSPQWRFVLLSTDLEHSIGGQVIIPDDPHEITQGTLFGQESTTVPIEFLKQQTPAVFRTELWSSGVPVETQDVTINYDGVEGRLWQLSHQATVTGGFTEDDRINVEATLEAVQVPFPSANVVGGIALRALGSIVQNAPIGLLSKQGCVDITGDGVLTFPGGIFNVNALGMTWQFLEVPPFFGKSVGALTEYTQRIVQLKVLAVDFTGETEVLQLIDAHSDQQFTTWGLNTIDRVEYSVTPGCSVQICWLQLLGT